MSGNENRIDIFEGLDSKDFVDWDSVAYVASDVFFRTQKKIDFNEDNLTNICEILMEYKKDDTYWNEKRDDGIIEFLRLVWDLRKEESWKNGNCLNPEDEKEDNHGNKLGCRKWGWEKQKELAQTIITVAEKIKIKKIDELLKIINKKTNYVEPLEGGKYFLTPEQHTQFEIDGSDSNEGGRRKRRRKRTKKRRKSRKRKRKTKKRKRKTKKRKRKRQR